MRSRRWSFVLLVTLVALACIRERQASQEEGGSVASGVTGGTDADRGVPLARDASSGKERERCPSDAIPPPAEQGGLTWQSEAFPTVTPPQNTGWAVDSNDPECGSLAPGSVPPSITWVPEAGIASCSAAVVDGHGDLSVDWGTGTTVRNSFFLADGSKAAAIANGAMGSPNKENQVWVAPSETGFVLVSTTFNPWCTFLRSLTPTGRPGITTSIDAPNPDNVRQIKPNPKGGYVLLRTTSDGRQPATQTLDVRFVGEDLQPLGDWQTVTTYHRPGEDDYPAKSVQWTLNVDQKGRALVLVFAYPPSFGPPAAPSTWKFSARWMGPDRPLTDEFKPITPTYNPASSGDAALFAGWGTIVPLAQGGFAAFHDRYGRSNGSVSPTGWYAFYPSAKAATAPAPRWLRRYDGSLQLLADGEGYVARDKDPSTCARTVRLIAPTGRSCFRLALEGAESCTTFPDAISRDGTFVIQDSKSPRNSCLIRWWPGLAKPGHKGSAVVRK